MKPQSLLSVLITTYNRAPYLKWIMERLIDYRNKGLDFNVIISDDCSTDETKTLCKEWSGKYDWLSCYRQEKNVGMDYNFANVYSHCDTKYCWLLGDHRYVSYEGLREIINTLDASPFDAYILNCTEMSSTPSKVYDDNINELFREQGVNLPNNASCIIPSDFYSQELFERYKGTTFLHLGIFIENATERHCKVKYLSNIHVKNITLAEFGDIGWFKHPFRNFGIYWIEFVLSLPPQISLENKLYVLKHHNSFWGVFRLRFIPGMIARYGNVYVDSYKECRRYVNYVSDTPKFIFDLIILIIPRRFHLFAWKCSKYCKRIIKGNRL